jgi:hypothetical protein
MGAYGQRSSEWRSSVYDWTLARSSDLTHNGRVRSLVTVADASMEAGKGRADAGVRLVIHDQTCPIAFWLPGKLTGVDLTRLGSALGGGDGASSHGAAVTRAHDLTQFGAFGHLVGTSDRSLTLRGSFLNVGDQRSTLNLGDTWTSSDDRTLRHAFGHFQLARPVTPCRQAVRGQRLYFVRVSI